MSDESPPPKKVGSLRDRIAQFESKPAAPAPAQRPVVPKKTWAWKEKQADAPIQPSPPAAAPVAAAEPSSSSEPAAESSTSKDHDPSEAASAGMSAQDALATITQGGGLKARLAALQGSGIGAPIGGPPVPPPPSGKPRVWKKAIVPHEPAPKPDRRPSTDETAEEVEEPAAAAPAAAEPVADEAADEPEEEQDEAEAERQRRAAIAARMARLGGARVGMPIVFGKAPPPPPPKKDPSLSEREIPAPQPILAPPVTERKPSTDDQSIRSDLVSEETTEEPEEDVPEDVHEHVQHPIQPVAASPPRPRPPIPAARAWSTSPPGSPVLRAEVVSKDGEEGEEVNLGEAEMGRDDEHGKKSRHDSEEADDEAKEKDREVPTPVGIPLPGLTPTPPASSSTSPPTRVPLPAMPKRAAPPRRKMPTPKPSADSAKSVEATTPAEASPNVILEPAPIVGTPDVEIKSDPLQPEAESSTESAVASQREAEAVREDVEEVDAPKPETPKPKDSADEEDEEVVGKIGKKKVDDDDVDDDDREAVAESSKYTDSAQIDSDPTPKDKPITHERKATGGEVSD